MKLRIPAPARPLHVVLVEPEIPQNTGNIARLCAATGSVLHLVEPLGFSTDERAVRRAGLDYWHLVEVQRHPDLSHCLEQLGCAEPLLFATGAERDLTAAPYRSGDALVFGRESRGLDAELLAEHAERTFAIPTVAGSVRSLNLANAVAIAVYEALRRTGALSCTLLEQ
ncbi:MAG: tRNA (cytidine(34)-2'-O)-methyltransferase [Polyangia bacterium]